MKFEIWMIFSLFYLACLKQKQIRYHIQRNSHGRYRYLKCCLKKSSQSLIFDSLNLFVNSKHIDVSSYNGYFLKRVNTEIALIFSQGCPLSRPLLILVPFLTIHSIWIRYQKSYCLLSCRIYQNKMEFDSSNRTSGCWKNIWLVD